MAYTDLREYVAALEKKGKLKRVKKEVDKDWELSAVCRQLFKKIPPHDRPALIFENVKGFAIPVVAGVLGASRHIYAIGLETDSVEGINRKWDHALGHPIAPRVVKEGPCKENILHGKDVDITKLPIPIWTVGQDPGPFFTSPYVITKDPETGVRNVGTYRMEVKGPNKTGFLIGKHQDASWHLRKNNAQNKPTPVAVVIGADPSIGYVSVSKMSESFDEFAVAGALRGAPVDLVPCETVPLEVPATAEIVLEGEIPPNALEHEGPFGEFTGYYASSVRAEPVVKIKAIYHRHDPIILGYPPSKPPNESSFVLSYYRSAMIWDELEKAGVPDIRGVWAHGAGAVRMFTVVSIRQRYPGHSRQAGLIATTSHAGAYLGRFTVVVDDDIDITNLHDVIWALSTRCDPETGMDVIRRCWSGPLDPIIPKGKKGFNSRAIMDACRPFEWMADFPLTVSVSDEIKKQTLKKWGDQIF